MPQGTRLKVVGVYPGLADGYIGLQPRHQERICLDGLLERHKRTRVVLHMGQLRGEEQGGEKQKYGKIYTSKNRDEELSK